MMQQECSPESDLVPVRIIYTITEITIAIHQKH